MRIPKCGCWGGGVAEKGVVEGGDICQEAWLLYVMVLWERPDPFPGLCGGEVLTSRSLRKEEVIQHMLWGEQDGGKWAQPPNNLGDSARIGGW